MSPSDSEVKSDSSDDFNDEDRPVLAMLSSSSSPDKFDAIFSVDSDVNISSSSHDGDVPLMRVLKGVLFDGTCMVCSWRTCSTRGSITACTVPIFH